jgi:hypothetical protein
MPPKQGPKGLSDYVEVSDRIQMFYQRYEDGRLVTSGFEIRDIGDRTWIIVQAHAYRTPDDPHPGVGTAWEQYPGRTPFTRDSELMNAETSAWGRALAAVGIAVKQGIATREDVEARRADSESNDVVTVTGTSLSDRDIEDIEDMVELSGVKPQKLQAMIVSINPEADINMTKGWARRAIGELSEDQAVQLNDLLAKEIHALAPVGSSE